MKYFNQFEPLLPTTERERERCRQVLLKIKNSSSSYLLPAESHHHTSEEEYPFHYPVVCHTWTALSNSDTQPCLLETYTQLKKG